MTDVLDRFLSTDVRTYIETHYYAPVNEQSRFELLRHNVDFLVQMEEHVALFSDHGVVHVRDVARHVPELLRLANGVLIPARSPQRLARMQGYGVLVAYLHDIGMRDFSAFGRAVHPEFAAQAVFTPELAAMIQAIWQENSGNVAWHLLQLADKGVLQNPQRVLQEMLSLSVCHSKSSVPMAVLIDLARLRELMQEIVTTDLPTLYYGQQVRKLRRKLATAVSPKREQLAQELTAAETAWQQQRQSPAPLGYQLPYQDIAQESYQWLLSPETAVQELVADVQDVLRILRCADALRQRGTVLKTSGGYEVFVNQDTGNAIYALRGGDEELFLLEIPSPLSAGEANIASSELDPTGDLRISFERGSFATPAAQKRAEQFAAVVVHDIQRDVLDSFQRPNAADAAMTKPPDTLHILLEETDDYLQFAAHVKAELLQLDAALTGRVYVVPSLQMAPQLERDRYLLAEPIAWDEATRLDFLKRIGQSGHRVVDVHIERAFVHVRLTTVYSGEVLIEAGASSTFVYIPLGAGLQVRPLGGYRSFSVQPWMPLGVTGVVRGANRNATVVADQKLQLLMIPKSVYLQHWHHTHSPASLREALGYGEAGAETAVSPQLTSLERATRLQTIPLFAGLSYEALLALANQGEELFLKKGAQLFAKGDLGSSMYVILSGQIVIVDDGEVVTERHADDVLGEMAALMPEPRRASAIAATDTHLLQLRQKAITQLLEAHPRVAREYIIILAERLRTMTADLAALRKGQPPSSA
ncbi:MAG: cyclic nucleotide-binding domain-containing protein [Chloroflexota bacterium]